MATRGRRRTKESKKGAVETKPKFPYTTKPSSLRRLLQEIPKKPKPPKFDQDLLKSWGFADANDYSMIRVLKAVGLLNSNNEPTDLYSQYMHIEGGAGALAEPIKKIYEPLFHASHAPYKESSEKLQNLFHIHSGGDERALDQQIQTFKALCENTVFEGGGKAVAALTDTTVSEGSSTSTVAKSNPGAAAVHINVHIHLPENKTRRDYEAIIEDIGRYIFGNTSSGRRDE